MMNICCRTLSRYLQIVKGLLTVLLLAADLIRQAKASEHCKQQQQAATKACLQLLLTIAGATAVFPRGLWHLTCHAHFCQSVVIYMARFVNMLHVACCMLRVACCMLQQRPAYRIASESDTRSHLAGINCVNNSHFTRPASVLAIASQTYFTSCNLRCAF